MTSSTEDDTTIKDVKAAAHSQQQKAPAAKTKPKLKRDVGSKSTSAPGDDSSSSSDDDDDSDDEGAESGGSEWEEEDDPDRLWCICRRPWNHRWEIPNNSD